MTYRTLLVNVEIDGGDAGLLHVACELADRLDADVVGSAICQPIQFYYGDGFISGDLIEQDLTEIDRGFERAEQRFRTAFGKRIGRVEWHTAKTFAPLANALVNDARGADLIISAAHIGEQFTSAHHVNSSDLVMQAGRPVLWVPENVRTLPLHRILVGWKDTKEARRAVLDALPLLKLGCSVIVAEFVATDEIAEAEIRLASVVIWLSRHGITAQAMAIPSKGHHHSEMLSFALSRDVDLIVVGAYGHSRLREWTLGGVTRGLLANTQICSVMSH